MALRFSALDLGIKAGNVTLLLCCRGCPSECDDGIVQPHESIEILRRRMQRNGLECTYIKLLGRARTQVQRLLV